MFTGLLCSCDDVCTRDPEVKYSVRQISAGKLNKSIFCGFPSGYVYLYLLGWVLCTLMNIYTEKKVFGCSGPLNNYGRGTV